MKWFVISATVLLGVGCAHSGSVKSQEGASSVKPSFFMTKPQPTGPVSLVVDEAYTGKKLQNYRRLPELRISGSGTFGPQALKELGKPLKKNQKANLFVVDLRQESHGLINDLPVTWEAEKNWGQADLNREEAIRRERRLLGDLHIGGQLGKAEIKSIETEESMVRTAGHQYLRLAVLDYVRPGDSEVDLFVTSVGELPEQAWVHFHCRDGGNRTALFLLLYDMLVNARAASFEEILKKHKELNRDPDFLAVGDSQDWQYPYSKERADFVREFYNYAKAHPRGEGALWSEWVQK